MDQKDFQSQCSLQGKIELSAMTVGPVLPTVGDME